MGWGWINFDTSWQEAFENITVGGRCTSAELSDDHHCDDSFVSRQLVMVDIDSGMTIDELKQEPLYQEFGAGYYCTPSHTIEAPRFRICFITETPITDVQKMRRLFQGLLKYYTMADTACKDAARIFFGTVECSQCERTDRILPDIIVDELIQLIPNRTKQTTQTVYEPQEINDISLVLDEYKKWYPTLPYGDRTNVAWAVFNSSHDRSQTIMLMRSRWSDHDSTGKYESMLNGNYRSGANARTLGSLITEIRKFNPRFRDKKGEILLAKITLLNKQSIKQTNN